MMIKIVSDGTTAGTTITDVETGKTLDDVRKMTIFYEAGERIVATLTRYVEPITEEKKTTESMAEVVSIDQPDVGVIDG